MGFNFPVILNETVHYIIVLAVYLGNIACLIAYFGFDVNYYAFIMPYLSFDFVIMASIGFALAPFIMLIFLIFLIWIG